MAKKLPPEARAPLEEFFADVLFNVMIGMIKAESVEAEFAKLREAAKKLTKEQMRRIAASAGKYYAERLPNKLSKEKVAALKKEALEFALEQLENEQGKQT